MDTDTLDESEDGRTQRNACPLARPAALVHSPLSLPLVAQTVFGAAAVISLSSLAAFS